MMSERYILLVEAVMPHVIEKSYITFLLIMNILNMITFSNPLLKYRGISWNLVITDHNGNKLMFKSNKFELFH